MYFLLSKHVLVFISTLNKWPLAAIYLNYICTTSDIQRHESSNNSIQVLCREPGQAVNQAEELRSLHVVSVDHSTILL